MFEMRDSEVELIYLHAPMANWRGSFQSFSHLVSTFHPVNRNSFSLFFQVLLQMATVFFGYRA